MKLPDFWKCTFPDSLLNGFDVAFKKLFPELW
jgi:hypothetical protein